MSTEDVGFLTVRTYTAGGALPVEGSIVLIKGADEERADLRISLLTDRSGLTDKASLPAPSRTASLSPGGGEGSYASYDIEVTRDGFYPKIIKSVPIFSGVSATLPVNMIPTSIYGEDSFINEEQKSTVITENEIL